MLTDSVTRVIHPSHVFLVSPSRDGTLAVEPLRSPHVFANIISCSDFRRAPVGRIRREWMHLPTVEKTLLSVVVVESDADS
jgi:hypothetical protein